ncbi:MAG: hypothetical protein HYR76_09895 [Ignavibacteria bacterium]|nr:hypothetical protein [Ignavibacteria bacterium]
MKNGNLYVFDSWNTDEARLTIVGQATLYSTSREATGKNHYAVSLDSIALLETNVIKNSGSATAMTVFTGITAAVTIFCISNPKACFGSCPTFYVSDGDSMRLQAEGFSSSISPSLEATDIDALYQARPSQGELIVEMRNEALETHVVRKVDLLVVPKLNGQRVFHGEDRQFWQTARIVSPISATAPEGDCLSGLVAPDGKERLSLADDTYLGEKETIELEFPVGSGQRCGLVVGCRQTLLPTYLLYQTFAYMGNDAGHWLAEIERKKLGGDQGTIERLIGGIEVFTQGPDEQWHSTGMIDEHGPLATDVHLVPLPNLNSTNNKVSVKLHMTKGAWRLDYVALAELSEPVKPIRLHPNILLRDNQEDQQAQALLLDSTKVLVTLPGDRYTLKYQLPDTGTDCEFFLESRGYYLEWIRKEWVEEENPFLLAEMFLAPERALRRLAPQFKRVEAQLEDSFWRSRYAKP